MPSALAMAAQDTASEHTWPPLIWTWPSRARPSGFDRRPPHTNPTMPDRTTGSRTGNSFSHRLSSPAGNSTSPLRLVQMCPSSKGPGVCRTPWRHPTSPPLPQMTRRTSSRLTPSNSNLTILHRQEHRLCVTDHFMAATRIGIRRTTTRGARRVQIYCSTSLPLLHLPCRLLGPGWNHRLHLPRRRILLCHLP